MPDPMKAPLDGPEATYPDCYKAWRWGDTYRCSTNCQCSQFCPHGYVPAATLPAPPGDTRGRNTILDPAIEEDRAMTAARDDIASGEVWPEDETAEEVPAFVTADTGGDLIRYVICLEDLVRWLARTYGYPDPDTGEMIYNDPIFPDDDGYGHSLVAAQDLRRTWHFVLHGTAEEVGSPVRGSARSRVSPGDPPPRRSAP